MNWARAGQTLAVLIPLAVIAAIVVKRFKQWAYKPASVESEKAKVISIVAYLPQHNPGLSVGEWTDEHAIDPLYDALEAIRPQVATQ